VSGSDTFCRCSNRSAAAISDNMEAARQFKEKFAALEYGFSESERNQDSSVSGECKKLIELAEIMPKALKLRMLRDLM